MATGVRASVSFGGAKGMALAAPLKAKTKRDDKEKALRMGSSKQRVGYPLYP